MQCASTAPESGLDRRFWPLSVRSCVESLPQAQMGSSARPLDRDRYKEHRPTAQQDFSSLGPSSPPENLAYWYFLDSKLPLVRCLSAGNAFVRLPSHHPARHRAGGAHGGGRNTRPWSDRTTSALARRRATHPIAWYERQPGRTSRAKPRPETYDMILSARLERRSSPRGLPWWTVMDGGPHMRRCECLGDSGCI